MNSLGVLHELFEYNYWARDRQLEVCATLSREQFLQPLGSSFSSVRDTLAHLVGSEWVWLQRWRGRSPKRADADLQEFVAEGFLTVEAVRDRWVVVERDVRDYLSDLTQKTLGEPLSYVNLEGEAWTYPLWQTLIHVVNHQTYHRGQVTTLLRQLGAQPVQIDFLVAYDLGFRRWREKIR